MEGTGCERRWTSEKSKLQLDLFDQSRESDLAELQNKMVDDAKDLFASSKDFEITLEILEGDESLEEQFVSGGQ